MNGIAPSDEVLNRAFQLAYFILGDRTASIYVALAAVDKLKTAVTIQDRRLHYTPTGRSPYPAVRTKLSLSHSHLLQRLIYTQSEPFERLLEAQENALRQEDMIIRFTKHLVRAMSKRNSFYVALGLCRLLYNYSTSETTEIYGLVMQDPDRGRDDYYYRSRKKHLLQELRERFGGLLKTSRGFRGEERFHSQEDSTTYIDLVKESLFRFTPWDSSCVLPDDLDPARAMIDSLLFKGKDPDEEHAVELNRIHTLLHPTCFERVVMTLGLDPPGRRLEVPYFFISSDDHGPTRGRLIPSELGPGELEAMRRSLDKKASQRKNASRKVFTILIDGDERACFRAGETSNSQVALEEDSELMEVLSVETDEEIALAIQPISHDERGVVPLESSIKLGAGQRLSLTIKALDGSSNEAAGGIVEVKYFEAWPIRLVSQLSPRLKAWCSDLIRLDQFRSFNYRKVALASLFIAALITGLWFLLQPRKTSPDPQLVTQQQGSPKQESQLSPSPLLTPSPLKAEPKQQATPPLPDARRPPESPKRELIRPRPPETDLTQDSGSREESEATRGRRSESLSTMLLAIQRVHVDPIGEPLLGAQIRATLIQHLHASSRFIVVEKRGEAQAVFKGTAKRLSSKEVVVTLRLVNAKGQVVWATGPRRFRTSTSGYAADIAQKLIRDLLADVQKLEGVR